MDLAEVIKELAADTMVAGGGVQVTMGEVIQTTPLKVRTDSGLELDACFLNVDKKCMFMQPKRKHDLSRRKRCL